MPTMLFFGERGEYGPYEVQTDGFPNAGQVVGDFLHKSKWSLEEFGLRYSQACDAELPTKKRKVRKTSITARRVQQMIEDNDVPRDIERRRVIAKLLNIPAVLLGLAQIDQAVSQTAAKNFIAPTILKKPQVDVSVYEQDARTFWMLHYASTAHGSLKKITMEIQELENIEKVVAGNMRRNVWKNLYSLYRLASRILCDQSLFSEAYTYANNAVRVIRHLHSEANSEESSEMLAVALYTRGFVRVEWGGRFNSPHLDREKITAAIEDFHLCLPLASPPLKGMALKELACAQALVSFSGTDTAISLRTVDQMEKLVGRRNDRGDSYDQILRDGALGGLNLGWYYVGKAITLIDANRPERAIEELDTLDALNTRGIPRDQTRNYAWVDIVRAQASLARGDFYTAIERAKQALVICKEINSMVNISIIEDIYRQLLVSRARNDPDVKVLGSLLYGSTVR